MKKLLLLVLLCIGGFAVTSSAQSIFNNTTCPIKVFAFCYNSSTCAPTTVCSTVTIPAGGSAGVPVCSCSSTELQGYRICYNVTGCNSCVRVGDAGGPYPCAAMQSTAILLPCTGTDCAKALISWDSSGNMIIQP